MIKEFVPLCKQCPRLKELYNEQQEGGLDKTTWRAVTRLLINSSRIWLAREFSKLSKTKYDYNSDDYIDDLSMKRPKGNVPCTKLGCTEADIQDCFKKIEKNVAGEIINSPAEIIAYTTEEKEELGIFLTKEGLVINENIYTEYILKNYRLLIQESGKYYMYRNNYWKPVSDMKLERALRFFFHKLEPSKWTKKLSSQYMGALRNECWDMDDVKTAEDYINVQNGLLNLNNFTLEQHGSDIFTTNQIPVIYNVKKKHDPQKDCPEFMKFLDSIFDDHSDKVKERLINFIQEIMGYCLSNSVKAHKFFMFLGDGSNGKSVLCDVLTELAGGVQNVSNVALKNFSRQFALSQIMDKTLNISTENEVEKNLDTQTIKAIVSGEAMQMEEKFKIPISYRPTAKLIFAVNTLPETADKSFGFGRRLICIPFNIRFVQDEPKQENERRANPNQIDLLMEELDGIFDFAVEGLKRLRARDYVFIIPKIVKKTMEEYTEANDPYLVFIKECIEVDEEAHREVNQKDIYEIFREWAAGEGHTKELKEAKNTKAFMTKFRSSAKNMRIGLIDETHSGDIYPLSGIRLSKKGEEIQYTIKKRIHTR